jgi:hypothetical protein
MGMFNDVYIDYPLPLAGYIPDRWKDIARIEISAGGFQTKDLSKDLSSYYIDNCGYLYLDKSDWEKDEHDLNLKINYHGYILIYAPICINEEKHFWLEYKLKYTDGKLVEAEMIHPKKEEIDELRLHTGI